MGLEQLFIVLVRPRQSGNIGAAARAVANHGLGGLVLVDPPAFDPDRARWMAPGAHDVVNAARIVGSVEEAVAPARLVIGTTARRRRWDWPVWGPDEVAAEVFGDPAPTAILFGPEDAGLSNEDLSLCHAALSLPTAEHASLNLAQAVTVTCAGLLAHARGRGAAPDVPTRQIPRRGEDGRAAWPSAEPGLRADAAPVAQQAAAVAEAVALLEEVGYLDSRAPEQVQGTLHRLLGRANPTPREVNVLRGMAAALRYALTARSR